MGDVMADMHFDPWLTATGAALANACAEIFAALPAPEITPGRKPRADATQRRKVCLQSLVANLAAFIFIPDLHRALSVPLSGEKRSRYDCTNFGPKLLSRVLKGLQATGLAGIVPGKAKQHRTSVLPTAHFAGLLARHGVTLRDVARLAGGETVLLRSKDPDEASATLREYADTSETFTMRREMDAINEAINSADIRLGGKPVPPTHLVRMFQGDFRHHGRMYRGFWQSLPKTERYLLSINGEAVADLDFSAMFLQLAYLREGVEMPCGDPYAVPGLHGCRGAVKKLISSLLARNGGAFRLPPGIKQDLPDGWTMKRFEKEARLKHPVIAGLFGKGLSLEFMFTESRILVAVLLGLAAKGIVGLPMHDGLMVAASHKGTAADMMQKISFEILGKALPVAEKTIA